MAKKIPLNPPRVTIGAALNPQSLTVPEMLSRLRCHIPGCNCRFPGGNVHCPRPRHIDRTPSFSIIEGSEGIVAECHTRHKYHAEIADCKPEHLQAALTRMLASTVKIEIPELEPMGTFFDWNAATKHIYFSLGRVGVYQVARLGERAGQEVRARRRDLGGNWIYNLDGVVPILYNLQLFPAARLLIVCDNERAADALSMDLERTPLQGLISTTTTLQGLSRLHHTDLSPLFGKDLVFFPSEDGGQNLYSKAIIKALDGRSKVRIVELPGLGPGGDYTHFRAAKHTLVEALALIQAAPR